MNAIKSLREKYNPAIRRLIPSKSVSIRQSGGESNGFPAVRYYEMWSKETDKHKARPEVSE